MIDIENSSLSFNPLVFTSNRMAPEHTKVNTQNIACLVTLKLLGKISNVLQQTWNSAVPLSSQNCVNVCFINFYPSASWVWMQDVSNRDTNLCLSHNNSPVHYDNNSEYAVRVAQWADHQGTGHSHQGCQVLISKNGQINHKKSKKYSTKKATYRINTPRHL